MSFASDLRADLDEIRAIPDELGLRPFDVLVRVITWSGADPSGRTGVGVGTSSYADTPFLVGYGHRPKVRQMTARDVIASGGLYHDQDLKVGPLTPAYPSANDHPSGGVAYCAIDPPVTGVPTQVYYRVSGNGLPGAGVWFDKFRDMADHAMNSYFVLRRSANQNPGGAP